MLFPPLKPTSNILCSPPFPLSTEQNHAVDSMYDFAEFPSHRLLWVSLQPVNQCWKKKGRLKIIAWSFCPIQSSPSCSRWGL
ncbi:unnamed protein product [Victoria cruziana]